MNAFLFLAMQTLIRTIVGALNYERIKTLVADQETSGLTGDEKRALVVQEARTIGLAVGYALLNLAIEVAVNALRQKTKA